MSSNEPKAGWSVDLNQRQNPRLNNWSLARWQLFESQRRKSYRVFCRNRSANRIKGNLYSVPSVSYWKKLFFVAQLLSIKGHGQTECVDKHRNLHSGNNRRAQVMWLKTPLLSTLGTEKNWGASASIMDMTRLHFTLTTLTDLSVVLAKHPTTIDGDSRSKTFQSWPPLVLKTSDSTE